MKRIWLVMLSLGLVLAFSASAFAVDVKFSGSFYAAGIYLDKVTLRDNAYGYPADSSSGVSTAFYYQRLRVKTDFIVSPGLTLITRFDALERVWGGARTDAGESAESENIRFEWAYIDYVTPVGTFDVGYFEHGVFGTYFNDVSYNGGAIKWSHKLGPVSVGAKVNKGTFSAGENSYFYNNTGATQSDRDNDCYSAYVKYAAKNFEAGLLAKYKRNATARVPGVPDSGSLTKTYGLNPYAKANFGPVTMEAELAYGWGKKDYENPDVADLRYSRNWGVYLDAVADFGKVYAGASGAFISGDEADSTDQVEGGLVHGGDWDPCLLMFNSERATWVGSLTGYHDTHADPFMGGASDYNGDADYATGAWFLQGRVGVRPTDKLDIVASLSWAEADEKPSYVLDELFGWEADITATYSITNNLSYMVGAAYLWTGDYYKCCTHEYDVNDNYLFINKLTLTF